MKSSALASALHKAAGQVAPPIAVVQDGSSVQAQPSRAGTKPITVHHPAEVRRQLKMLAAEQGRAIEDMAAEAFNLLFAKYRKAEIAPVRGTRP